MFHREPKYLFVQENRLPRKNGVIVSRAKSALLGMTFVFESTIPPLETGLLRFSMCILIVLAIVMAIAIAAVMYSTVPIRKCFRSPKNPISAIFWQKRTVK